MIRHIVMFDLTTDDPDEKARVRDEIRERLLALVGVIPGLQTIAFESDLGLIESHSDLVLISDHDDNDALVAYQAHPAHQAAGAFIKSVTTAERTTVDFEL